jgi:hypothetical protein
LFDRQSSYHLGLLISGPQNRMNCRKLKWALGRSLQDGRQPTDLRRVCLSSITISGIL